MCVHQVVSMSIALVFLCVRFVSPPGVSMSRVIVYLCKVCMSTDSMSFQYQYPCMLLALFAGLLKCVSSL